MGTLANTFSWSFSAAGDFDECRRKRYWAKYAMWGGWDRDASAEQKAAYRLTKMENRYSLLGNAVEQAVMWALRKGQANEPVTVEQAYEEVARPYLNGAWKESKEKQWKLRPKKYCCLHEHYYPRFAKAPDKEWTAGLVDRAKQCISNFVGSVLPELRHVSPADEVPVATVEAGDPESFEFNGVKVYAIPDYVFRRDNRVHIYDWKSGKQRAKHMEQVALYGLWAHEKHDVPADRVTVHIEYLASDTREERGLSESVLDGVRERIAGSVQDMTEYLVDGDMARNEPVPREEWDLAPDQGPCRMCSFFELCEPELGGGVA